jgi:protocatechuate 3,4-dioxygenase beta subunit
MILTKLKLVAVLLIAASWAAWPVGDLIAQPDAAAKNIALQNRPPADAPAPKDEKAANAKIAREPDVLIAGSVMDEAKNPIAGATVMILGDEWKKHNGPVKTNADGAFQLPLNFHDLPGGKSLNGSILVEGANGALGYWHITASKRGPIQVVLKPARHLIVDVVDADGKPVIGADVIAMADFRRVSGGQTGKDGRWKGAVPSDLFDSVENWGVVAKKSKVGLDYAVPKRPTPLGLKDMLKDIKTAQEMMEEKFKKAKTPKSAAKAPDVAPAKKSVESKEKAERMPSQFRLTLDGARTVRIKTLDQDGKPVAGVRVGVSLLQIPGRADRINLSSLMELWPATTIDGAVFDWLPDRFINAISFITYSDDFYAIIDLPGLKGPEIAQELTRTMAPRERLSGRVTQPDGRPAAGVLIEAAGDGPEKFGRRYRGVTRTDADGRYVLKVYTAYAITVRTDDERWEALEQGPFTVRAAKPLENVNFVVNPIQRKAPKGPSKKQAD